MNTFSDIKKKNSTLKVLACRTTGDNVVKESRSLPVGVGVELYTWHCCGNLRRGVEATAFQVADVLLLLRGDEQDVARLKVALLQTEHTLQGRRGRLQTGYSVYRRMWLNSTTINITLPAALCKSLRSGFLFVDTNSAIKSVIQTRQYTPLAPYGHSKLDLLWQHLLWRLCSDRTCDLHTASSE